jgi:hypothetical protein
LAAEKKHLLLEKAVGLHAGECVKILEACELVNEEQILDGIYKIS